MAGIISASRGSGVRRAVRSPLSGSSHLSAAITTTAQVTSLNIRPLRGKGEGGILRVNSYPTARMIFCMGDGGTGVNMGFSEGCRDG